MLINYLGRSGRARGEGGVEVVGNSISCCQGVKSEQRMPGQGVGTTARDGTGTRVVEEKVPSQGRAELLLAEHREND